MPNMVCVHYYVNVIADIPRITITKLLCYAKILHKLLHVHRRLNLDLYYGSGCTSDSFGGLQNSLRTHYRSRNLYQMSEDHAINSEYSKSSKSAFKISSCSRAPGLNNLGLTILHCEPLGHASVSMISSFPKADQIVRRRALLLQ